MGKKNNINKETGVTKEVIEALLYFSSTEPAGKNVEEVCINSCLLVECNKTLQDITNKIDELELHCGILSEFNEVASDDLKVTIDTILNTVCKKHILIYEIFSNAIYDSNCVLGATIYTANETAY